MYETYKLSPESYNEIRKKIIRNFSVIMIFIFGIMVTSTLWGAENRSNAFQTIGITILVATLGSIWSVNRGIKRTKAVLKAFASP